MVKRYHEHRAVCTRLYTRYFLPFMEEVIPPINIPWSHENVCQVLLQSDCQPLSRGDIEGYMIENELYSLQNKDTIFKYDSVVEDGKLIIELQLCLKPQNLKRQMMSQKSMNQKQAQKETEHDSIFISIIIMFGGMFCNLSLSTKCSGGLYAGCDNFSCDYALPSYKT